MPTQKFGRGNVDTESITILKKNAVGRYTAISEAYKFVENSLYNEQKIVPLPSWINFDQLNQLFTLSPTSQQPLGSYHISSTITTEVSQSEFNITNETEARGLMSTLIVYGYLDYQHFVTGNFGKNQLDLPIQYNSLDEKKIHSVLAKHSFDVFLSVSV